MHLHFHPELVGFVKHLSGRFPLPLKRCDGVGRKFDGERQARDQQE